MFSITYSNCKKKSTFANFFLTLVYFFPVVIASHSWSLVFENTADSNFGVYETKEIPNSAIFPCGRASGATWSDSKNNLWLFGGYFLNETTKARISLNDLWKYKEGNWTLIMGSNSFAEENYFAKGFLSPFNIPPRRSFPVYWIDSKDNFWLFGGESYFNDFTFVFGDFWKFDGTEWTWIYGGLTFPSNNIHSEGFSYPSARSDAGKWIDSKDNFYLYGGRDAVNYPLNDFWKFDGTKWNYIEVDSVNPGFRYGFSTWLDSNDHLFLFGGYSTKLNADLWKWDGKWTLISGIMGEHIGVYGIQGKSHPGSRFYASSWKDSHDNLYLFGGFGFSESEERYLDDLWKYDGNWTWISGSKDTNDSLQLNSPSSRYQALSFMDRSNLFWIFGGIGKRVYRDMWKLYVPEISNPKDKNIQSDLESNNNAVNIEFAVISGLGIAMGVVLLILLCISRKKEKYDFKGSQEEIPVGRDRGDTELTVITNSEDYTGDNRERTNTDVTANTDTAESQVETPIMGSPIRNLLKSPEIEQTPIFSVSDKHSQGSEKSEGSSDVSSSSSSDEGTSSSLGLSSSTAEESETEEVAFNNNKKKKKVAFQDNTPKRVSKNISDDQNTKINSNTEIPVAEEHKVLIEFSELALNEKVGDEYFGEVWVAIWKEKNVSIKKMKNEIPENSLADLEAEVRLVKNIRSHPNVVAFYGMCKIPLCLVTEFVARGPLNALLARSEDSLTKDVILKILKGIARGMLHLGEEKIVHKDLASRNILITENFEAKIGDFGLSLLIAGSFSENIDEDFVRWMAPESIQKSQYSTKSDVYSFGITIVEILTKKRPFDRIQNAYFLEDLREGRIFPVELPSESSEQIHYLVQACTEKDAHLRPSFEQISNILENPSFRL